MKKYLKIFIGLMLLIASICLFFSLTNNGNLLTNSSNETFSVKKEHSTFKSPDGKIYTEYKQYDSKWADEKYWGKTMKKKGCGITAIAIVLSGYGKKDTPKDLQKKYYPVMAYENMSQELLENYNIKSSGFYYDATSLSEEKILEHLNKNKPLIVCAWAKKGINRWTKNSHYLVLLAADDKKNIYVANPGGSDYGINKNGWYPASEVVPYLAKALYIES